MKKVVTSLAFAAMLVSGSAMAQTAAPDTATDVPGHPRVNEVDQRLNNQQNRIDNGVQGGQINANQEERDQKTDAKVQQEMSADQAKNGGHITKAEQTKMNNQLNHDSKRIHHQRKKGSQATPASASPAGGAAPTTTP